MATNISSSPGQLGKGKLSGSGITYKRIREQSERVYRGYEGILGTLPSNKDSNFDEQSDIDPSQEEHPIRTEKNGNPSKDDDRIGLHGGIVGPLPIDKDSYFNDRSHLLEEENNFVKIGNSIVGLASGSLDAATQRAEKAWDSPYDFVNYWTWGLPDIISGTYEGMEERADKLDDSPYDFFNWISMGFLDTAIGTVAPDDLYSEEHLANSAALAFFILGGRTAIVKNKSSKLETSPNVNNGAIGEVVEGTGNIISEADNLKLSQWKYRPSDELYIQYKHVFDNPKYYDQSTGSINWPINDGFEGVAKETTLKPGARIDRYGFESGTFVSPVGIPYEMRSLAPGTKSKPYHVYEVLKPIDGLEGKIAPWFDEAGGGVQYKLTKSIQDLLDEGYLREVFD